MKTTCIKLKKKWLAKFSHAYSPMPGKFPINWFSEYSHLFLCSILSPSLVGSYSFISLFFFLLVENLSGLCKVYLSILCSAERRQYQKAHLSKYFLHQYYHFLRFTLIYFVLASLLFLSFQKSFEFSFILFTICSLFSYLVDWLPEWKRRDQSCRPIWRYSEAVAIGSIEFKCRLHTSANKNIFILIVYDHS